MSYAQRPMGDYKTYGYAGDPGWLSSIWKGIKKVAPAILGGIIGGPAGALIGAAGSGGGAKPRQMPSIPGTVGGAISFPGGIGVQAAWQPGTAVTRYKYPRAIAGQPPPVVPGYAGAGMGAVPSGYHYAKDGSGRIVRNRRMNVANPRALRRSMRRVQGFEKLAKRTIQFTRRVKMKKRRST